MAKTPNKPPRQPFRPDNIDSKGSPGPTNARGVVHDSGEYACLKHRRNRTGSVGMVPDNKQCAGSLNPKQYLGGSVSTQKDHRVVKRRSDSLKQPILCPLGDCARPCKDTQSLISHLRTAHHYRGSCTPLVAGTMYAAQFGASIEEPEDNHDNDGADNDDGEREEDDTVYYSFVSYDEHDGHGDASGQFQGPPGDGGSAQLGTAS